MINYNAITIGNWSFNFSYVYFIIFSYLYKHEHRLKNILTVL